MKLATVNPRLDFNMETLLSKDVRIMPELFFPNLLISLSIDSLI